MNRFNPFAARTDGLGFHTTTGGTILTNPTSHRELTAQARADKAAYRAIQKAQERLDAQSLRQAMILELMVL